MARIDSASSTAPHPNGFPRSQSGPPIAQQPNPSALTWIRLRPSDRVIVVITRQ